MLKNRTWQLLLLALILSCLTACQSSSSNTDLFTNFRDPPTAEKPWLYWYWINNHLSETGITKDLEAMAEVGIGAALIGNIYLDRIEEDGDVTMLSPEWKRLTQHAIREGGRLGVDIGLFNSPGWSQSGGPWNDTDNSMRYLASEATRLTGPQIFSGKLTAPAGDFRDVAVIAFPTPPGGAEFSITNVDLTGEISHSLTLTAPASPPDYQSLTLTPTASTFVADAVLSANVDGNWQTVREFRFDRSNNMEQIGFEGHPPLTVAFPAVQAREYRLELTGVRPTRGSKSIGFASVTLSPTARLEYATEKQLALMHPTPLPLDDAYRWPAQAEPEKEQVVAAENVLNLTDKLNPDGTLDWEVPAGEWTVLRTGMLPTGVKNSPAAPNASGPDVDKMNRKALQQHFDGFIGEILNSMPPAERTAFKYVVADSYEMGGQNWTDDFAVPFEETYGYDPLPWLPVLSGHVVGSVDQSNRFLWDLRRLVADRVAYEYVGGLRKLCNDNGLKLWLENYGHWGFPSEFLTYGGQSDFIGGEFWNEGDLGSIECRAASSAAHIYGKEQVSAESFTSAGKPFLRHPAMLKKRGDWSFTEGINHRVYHVYIQQPYEEKLPGVNAWFGTEFNRHNTWFSEAKSWIDYERRCGNLLRRGTYVADLAYFIGEDAPKMTGVTNPSVPTGYSFDYINAEVLLERATVQDGRIALPDGPSYRILVLPPSETMRPEMLERIAELVDQGATITGSPPVRSPSLKDYENADARVKEVATELWKNPRVHETTDLAGLLRQLKTPPDLILPAGSQVRWIHRSAAGRQQEIYFLTNQGDEPVDFIAGFRAKDLRPEWWDPITGERRQLPEFRGTDDHINIPLRLLSHESGFVVFSEPEGAAAAGKNYPEPDGVTVVNGPWQVRFENEFLNTNYATEMAELSDWSTTANDTIKYFSGTATYQTTFPYPGTDTGNRVILDLGEAAVVANITLNGRYVGGLWTVPWQLDVTDFLQPGENELTVEVTNLWVNQLLRDAARPAADKKTWTLTNQTYPADTPLQPSGLLGPVTLKSFNPAK